MTSTARVEDLRVATYTVPTDGPEADGTLTWDTTTAVVVHVQADGTSGMGGWTYSSPAAGTVVIEHLAEVLTGRDPFDITGAWEAMRRSCRNYGTAGS